MRFFIQNKLDKRVWLFTKRQILRLVQMKAFAGRQNKYYLKTEILFWVIRKQCEKRRKCWLPAFSPFPTMFSNGLIFREVKSRDSVVKG